MLNDHKSSNKLHHVMNDILVLSCTPFDGLTSSRSRWHPLGADAPGYVGLCIPEVRVTNIWLVQFAEVCSQWY